MYSLELITQYPIHTIVTLFLYYSLTLIYLHTPIIFLLDFGLCNDQAKKNKLEIVPELGDPLKLATSDPMPPSHDQ